MGDIADEHYSRIMWEVGDPYVMENNPFCDTPEFGGWKAYLLRHANDPEWMRIAAHNELHHHGIRLDFSFCCRYCGEGITFIDHKPFDAVGPHRCLAEGRGTIK